MKISRFNSIGFRFGLVVAGLIVMLITVLFVSYVKKQRQNTIEAEVHAARNLILMAESVRENMEEKWELGLFSTESLRNLEYTSQQELKQKLLAAVPVSAAWSAAKAKSREGGFEFRTPREGARNKDNEPDAIERSVLSMFAGNSQLKEHYIIDEEKNAVRYFRPVRLSETCLNCHGDPATSYERWRRNDGKDITGYKMDGKKVGDLHGAFEIIRPLDDADAALAASLWKAAAIVSPLVILAVFFTWTTMRKIVTSPLEKAVDLCRDIASGDLTQQVSVTGNDEVSELMRTLNRMTQELRAIVAEVVEGVNMITGASQEISAGNLNLSQRTEEQASSLEETAASMEEMTSTVIQNADSAQQANQLANSARGTAEKGGHAVERTVKAMSEINSSSTRIADIISTIDGIAFQTNLLALNAAVEAARAGEQGRGFAVVASEVRSLAQRSADAAKEIKGLIEDSVEKVKVGTDLVDESGKTLMGIVEGIKKVSDIVAEINAASQEQSAGIDQVNNAVAQMDDMTQQNAALVEESAAASRSMQDQARSLADTVGFFKVGSSSSSRHANILRTPEMERMAVHSLPQARSMTAGRSLTEGKNRHLQKIREDKAKTRARKTGTDGSQEWEDF